MRRGQEMRGRPPSRRCAPGIQMRNVEPVPGPTLYAQARPSIASARARATARPMPNPPGAATAQEAGVPQQLCS